MPFASQYERAIHFDLHGHEFGAADEIEYERMADAFMSQMVSPMVQQCRRRKADRTTGDRVRLHFQFLHFGTAHGTPEVIRTFYIPPVARVNRFGGPALYLRRECDKVFED